MNRFAILKECTVTGRKHWVHTVTTKSESFTTANGNPPPDEMAYPDKGSADMWADHFRADNARRAEATKRKKNFRTEPARFTVVEVSARKN
jgi:hypothetical protein